jgi:glycosyltransferase involved in cell wall biosynthesis
MISYCISVYNEKEEISRLLDILTNAKTENEEIVVLQTYRDQSEKESILHQDIKSIILQFNIDVYDEFHFENKFSNMKNYLNSLATKEYIFNFDADELILHSALEKYRKIIQENQNIDLYYIPRINTVEGLTEDDIKSWSWKINEFGWVNWPDYQPRIYRNIPNIKWIGDVHEYINGYSKAAYIPMEPSVAIIHNKNIHKQRKQNQLYSEI